MQILLSREMLCLDIANKILGLLGFTSSGENDIHAIFNMPLAATEILLFCSDEI